MVKKKYRALRLIAFILQVFAWVTLVLTILAAIGAVGAGAMSYIRIDALQNIPQLNTTAGIVAGIISGVGILIAGIINFIVLMAGSDFLSLQIDIEHNTRQSNEYLRQLLMTQQAPAPEPGPTSTQPPVEPVPATPTITVQTPTAQ
jgi:hypothetical protein